MMVSCGFTPREGGKDAPVHHEEALGVVRLELLVEDAARRIAAGAAAPQRMKSGQFEHRRREPRGAQGEISDSLRSVSNPAIGANTSRAPAAKKMRARISTPRRSFSISGLPSRHVRVLLHHARHPRSHEGQGEGAELRRSEDSFEENSLAVEIVDAQALRHALPALRGISLVEECLGSLHGGAWMETFRRRGTLRVSRRAALDRARRELLDALVSVRAAGQHRQG